MSGVYVPARRDTSLLTTVMKGVSIAKDLYGMKIDSDKLEAAKNEEARVEGERKRLARGEMNQGEYNAGILSGKMVASKPDEQGAVPVAHDVNGGVLYAKASAPKGEKSPMGWVASRDKSGRETRTYGPLTAGMQTTLEPAPRQPPQVAPGQDKRDATSLRKEYDNNDTTKRTNIVTDAYRGLKSAAANASPSAATDMRLIFAYMKMMDPTSTVREGEYASAENTRGIPDSILAQYNKAKDGKILDPAQRANFGREAEDLVSAQLESQAEVDAQYAKLAEQYGTKPEYVVGGRYGDLGKSLKDSIAKRGGPQAPATGKPGPGSTVQIGDKRFKVLSDGNSLEEIGATGQN